MLDHLPAWVLNEPVDVTLVACPSNETIDATYLVSRVDFDLPVNGEGVAITLSFNDVVVLVNGRYVDLGEDLMPLCGMIDQYWDSIDSTVTNPSEMLGVTVRSEPFVD